ncbi:MAG: T9SS type A sorting domain-containing protein [Chitinophagaceae bacterium]
MSKAFLLLFFTIDILTSSGQTGLSQFSDPTGKYSTSSSGTCIACSFSNPSYISDNNLGNYATINVGASVFGAVRGIRAKLSSLVSGGTKAGFYINVGSVVSFLPSVDVNTYKAGVYQETIVSNGDLISLLGGSAGNVCASTNISKQYDEVEINFNMGALTVGATMQVYYAFGGFSSCPSVTLPVRFIDLAVLRGNDNAATVTFTFEDDGNSQYNLEKSSDGHSFTIIDSKTSGTQAGQKNIQFIDALPGQVAYYRVSVENTHGQRIYSKIVTYHAGVSGEKFDIFPNPVSGNQFIIGFHSIDRKTYTIRIFDNTAHLLYSATIVNSSLQHLVNLNKNIPAGIYNISISETNSAQRPAYKKIIFVK